MRGHTIGKGRIEDAKALSSECSGELDRDTSAWEEGRGRGGEWRAAIQPRGLLTGFYPEGHRSRRLGSSGQGLRREPGGDKRDVGR